MDSQVLQCLQATLSPDEAIRTHAEEQLKQLFQHPEGGLSLARILLSQEVETHQRQISVLLQKYISTHWSYHSVSFEDPACTEEVKAQVRPIVFHGLSDSNRKIRSASAFALSTIAKYDWPEDYPSLLTDLVNLLSGSSDSVHGAMRVIAEFVKNDLSEDQLIPVVQGLVPALLQVLGNAEAHSPATRASTINVFRQVIRMLETVRDEHPQAVREALEGLCPAWFSAFQQLLANDPAAELKRSWEYIGIRIEIFRTFNLFWNAFPKILTSDITTYLRLSINNLSSLLDTFKIHYLITGDNAIEPPSPTSDVGFIVPTNGIDDLACGIFDFLTPTVRNAKAAGFLVDGSKGSEQGTETLRQILELVLEYVQVTRANEEEWLDDPNAFVMDEDDESDQYGLRTVGFDLIGSLIDKFSRPVAAILQELTTQRVQSSAANHGSDPDWWKPLEASLALLGGIGDDVRNVLEEDEMSNRTPTINLGSLFDQVVPGLLNATETPFLQGRAFVFASQFASSLPPQLAGQYLAAAVTALDAEELTPPVKLSAIKTIRNFCRFVDASVIQTQSGKILSLLLPFLIHADGETLYLILETIRAVIGLEKSLLNAQTVPQVAERVFEVWLKFSQDPVATAIVEELFETISATSPDVCRSLVLHVAPRLAAIISTPTTEDTVHLPAEAIQLSNSLLRSRGSGIEAELVATVTAAVLSMLQSTDDMDIVQHGCLHLTMIVRKDCPKLVEWRDPAGHNGIASIFGILGRLLAPTFSESGGIFVGDLIMHLFRKAGESIGPVLPDLARAITERLSTATMSSFVISLVLPFAYLFGTEYTLSTIDLLSSFAINMADGSAKNGLDIVLNAWVDNCDSVVGSWDLRVSSMGLSKLFVLRDERLQRVMVKGDMIITERQRNTIMTRSKTKNAPIQYTSIPFPVKALKLLLKDVQVVEGKKGGKISRDVELDDDDGDEEWDDDDPLGDVDPVDEFGYLSSWLDQGAKNDDAQDDDEDLKSDPLAQVDMAQHLTGLLREMYTSNSNGIHEMIEGLTDEEKGILRQTLSS